MLPASPGKMPAACWSSVTWRQGMGVKCLWLYPTWEPSKNLTLGHDTAGVVKYVFITSLDGLYGED